MQEGIKSNQMQKYFDPTSWNGPQNFSPWLCHVQHVSLAIKSNLQKNLWWFCLFEEHSSANLPLCEDSLPVKWKLALWERYSAYQQEQVSFGDVYEGHSWASSPKQAGRCNKIHLDNWT